MPPTTTDLTDPRLIVFRGARAIQKVAQLPDKRAAYHACESGALPAFKDGGRWCLRLITYLAHLEAKEAEALAERQAAKAARAAAKAANGSEDQIAPPPRESKRRRPKPAKRGRSADAEP